MIRNRILVEWYSASDIMPEALEELNDVEEMIRDSMGYYDGVTIVKYAEPNPPEE